MAALRSITDPPASTAEIRVVGPDGPLTGRLRPPFSPWGRALVAATARRWGADLVHGLHVELPPGRVPPVVTVHDLVPLDVAGSISNLLGRQAYRRVLSAALRRASRVIVPSPLARDRLVAHGADPARLVVVPLGVAAVFRPLDAAERDQARHTFGDGRRYVVASTGPRPHKNLDGLLRAAALLARDVAVTVTGPAPRRGVTGVSFVGRLGEGDLARFYGGAEAMVLPALVEGFGLPALEALACGVPVVCGPETGALAFLRQGMVEVDVRRPAALAAGIRELLDDDGLRSRLGAAGRAAAAALTVEAMARATLGVYRDVLSSRQARPR